MLGAGVAGNLGEGEELLEGSSSGTTSTTAEEVVSRDEYERVRALSAKRLRGWRATARKRQRLLRAMRERVHLHGANGVLAGLLCLHGHEGPWDDPDPPYWGGLQMDRSFMATYGGPFYRALGTADHWPAILQLAVGAEAFYVGRGFTPWPVSSRLCGLR